MTIWRPASAAGLFSEPFENLDELRARQCERGVDAQRLLEQGPGIAVPVVVPRALRLRVHLVRTERGGRHVPQRPRGRSAGNIERGANLLSDAIDESEQIGSARGARDDDAARFDVVHLHLEPRVGPGPEDRPDEHRAGPCVLRNLMTSRAIGRREAELAEARFEPIGSNDVEAGRLRERRHQHACHAVRQPRIAGSPERSSNGMIASAGRPPDRGRGGACRRCTISIAAIAATTRAIATAYVTYVRTGDAAVRRGGDRRQRRSDVVCGIEALGRVLCETAIQDRREGRRHVVRACGARPCKRRASFRVENLPENARRPVSISCRTAPNEKTSDRASASSAADLLRRHVAGRAHHDTRDRADRRSPAASVACFARSEIENLHDAVSGDEQIVRLEIAVNDAFVVRRRQAGRDLPRQRIVSPTDSGPR